MAKYTDHHSYILFRKYILLSYSHRLCRNRCKWN